mmetsp:Transcript_50779/g.121367  ORF Transcript_50779/g.121367 Transcript_50779/m.121367 type:complete len:451 (-) Transcript_50779:558-1910(-)
MVVPTAPAVVQHELHRPCPQRHIHPPPAAAVARDLDSSHGRLLRLPESPARRGRPGVVHAEVDVRVLPGAEVEKRHVLHVRVGHRRRALQQEEACRARCQVAPERLIVACTHLVHAKVFQRPRHLQALLLGAQVEDGQADGAVGQRQQHAQGLVGGRWPRHQLRLQGVGRGAHSHGGQIRAECQRGLHNGRVDVILVDEQAALVLGDEIRPGQRRLLRVGPVDAADGTLVEHGVVVPHELNCVAAQVINRLQLRGRLAAVLLAPGLDQRGRQREVCGGHPLSKLLVLRVQLLVHGQNLRVHEASLVLHKVHIAAHVLGPHVLGCVQAHALHPAVQELLQMPHVLGNHLLAAAELGPLPAAPALEHVMRVVPLLILQANPGPLEVVAVQVRPEGVVQPLLQLFHLTPVPLRLLPFLTRGNHCHVVEHTVGDHDDPEVRRLLAEPPQALSAA